jgi:hypothetical protein
MMASASLGTDHCVLWAQVPKMLGTLRSTWAPEAFIVSFKLETDEQILKSKVYELPIGLAAGYEAITTGCNAQLI